VVKDGDGNGTDGDGKVERKRKEREVEVEMIRDVEVVKKRKKKGGLNGMGWESGGVLPGLHKRDETVRVLTLPQFPVAFIDSLLLQRAPFLTHPRTIARDLL
jgi:hypothetical protein